MRFLCVGFWAVEIIAICTWTVFTITPNNGAVSSFREYGFPCGLCGSLCMLQLSCSALRLRNNCNTRYEWLVRPYSAGTFTLQETPSFAWRTNGLA
jgi:hypothetical protein